MERRIGNETITQGRSSVAVSLPAIGLAVGAAILLATKVYWVSEVLVQAAEKSRGTTNFCPRLRYFRVLSGFSLRFSRCRGPRWAFSAFRRHHGPDLLRRNCRSHQVSHAHQVVGCAREGKDPIYLQGSAMTHFAQQRDGLQPAKTFFDALPFLLTEGVASMSRGSTIDRAAASPSQVLRHVRRHPQVRAFAHKIRGVETFVTAHRHAPDVIRRPRWRAKAWLERFSP
jgi:hypothetical protein